MLRKLSILIILVASSVFAQYPDFKNDINENYAGGEIDFSTNVLDFDSISVSDSRVDSFYIYNIGSAELVIDSIYSINNYFEVSEFNGIINSLDSIVVKVTFIPESYGNYEGSIVILSDDRDESTSTIELSGFFNSEIQRIKVSALNLNFKSVSVGMSDTLSVLVYNVGDSILAIIDVYCSHPNITFALWSLVIEPGDSTLLDVIYTPTNNGKIETELEIFSDDPIMPALSIQIIGKSSRKFYVPENFQTIQAAINYMVNGDSLIIAPGNYHEQITIDNKNLFICSNFYTSANPEDISNTIIDGNDSLLIFNIKNISDSLCISGITIRNGNSSDCGGGMYIDNSNIILSDIILKKNSAFLGGAIFSQLSIVHLYSVLIDSNNSLDAGGIFAEFSTLKLDNVIISNNTAADRAGGIGLYGESSLEMVDCSIISNSCSFMGGGICTEIRAVLNIQKSIFSKNKATDLGGAIFLTDESQAVVENCNFNNNKCEGDYGGGGAIDVEMLSSLLIKSSLIIKNTATFGGGGILCNDSDVQLINVTISGNRSNYAGGGLYFMAACNPVIVNSIVYTNSPSKIAFFDVTDSEISVAYSLIQGGQSGIDKGEYGTINWLNGNIDNNPAFVDYFSNNFALQYDSPCIGAGIDYIQIGDSIYLTPEYDYYNNIRPNPVGSNPDLGAIENKYGVPTSINNETISLPVKFLLDQNYPNPFNPVTKINFSISQPGITNLTVYTALGEKVTVLLNEFKKAGHFQVEFDGSKLASGIYFYRLQSGTDIQVKKMLLMK